MHFKLMGLAPAALALALACSTAVQAQTAAATQDSRHAKVEQRIRDMYTTIHIQPAQDAQWNAYAQVMLDNAQAMDAVTRQSGGDRGAHNAAEILDNYAAISAQHAQNVERLSAAFDVLYASLSAEQKRAADEMFRMSGRKKVE
jgi:outer membrane receptor for monomeric catechols